MGIVTLIATIITIIGCTNWFIVGIFSFNFVTWIVGAGFIARVIYAIVGIAGFWLIFVLIKNRGQLVREKVVS